MIIQKNKKRFLMGLLGKGMLLLPSVLFVLPILLLLSGSVTDAWEWKERMQPLFAGQEAYMEWKWVPDYPTLEHYKRLLFYSPQFLTLFWNSLKITGLILLGQMLIGLPSAWAFAAFPFRGRNALFTVYVILMFLPFQVTMLSKYIALKSLGLLDTTASVILPAVFSTFPVFLLYRSFSVIPKELLEAGRMDGAGEWGCFFHIGLPLAKSGITAAFVIGFLESFNMIEEPLAFLETKSLWPLSLYLPEIGMEQAGFACAASVLTLCVSLFVFAIFRDSLEQGIISSALKM